MIEQSWKRKIIETGSITNYKKSKVDFYVSGHEENIDPNIVPLVQEKPIQKQTLSPVVAGAGAVAAPVAETKIEAETNNGPSQVEELNVDSMKVSELREELRLRNLDDRGKKKMLQERFQQDIDQRSGHETKKNKEEEFADDKESKSEVQEEVTEPITEDDVEMIESTNANHVAEPEPTSNAETYEPEPIVEEDIGDEAVPSKDVSMESTTQDIKEVENAKESVSMFEEVPVEQMDEEPMDPAPEPEVTVQLPTKSKVPIGKKIKNLFSPGKLKKSAMKQAVANESAPIAQNIENSEMSLPSKDDNSATAVRVTESLKNESTGSSDDKRTDSSSTFSSLLSHTSDAKPEEHQQPMTTPAVPTKTAGKMFLSSIKMKTKEERSARLKEMRDKIKKNQESAVKSQPKTAASHSTSSTSSQNSAEASAEVSAEERKKAIAAKMRQKLALNKPAVAVNMTPSQPPVSESTVYEQLEQKVMSPVDNYEMSDREESDSGEESDENESSPKKKIPKWAQKSNLLPALERQFLEGPHKIDPDSIFHEVSSCDLVAIFGEKKQKYSQRKSTGDWRKDRVTRSEIITYKKKMGFEKK